MSDRRRPTLWVISELYYPEETSTGYFMTGIAEGLATRFPVRVLCAQPTYSVRGKRAPRRERRRDVAIRRVWSTTWSNQRPTGRLANLMTITLSVFVNALLRFRRGDRVLVESTPPVLPFAVAVACFLRRASCVVLIHDAYPEVLIAAGMARANSLPVRLMHRATVVLQRFATRVVVVGRGMQARVRERLPAGHASKVRVIRSWADTEAIQALPRSGSRMLDELGLAERFVVQYAGNISRLNDIDNLVEVMAELSDDPDIHFLFIGRGGRRDWLESEIERRSLRNVTLLDWLPRSESPELHRACDLVLIPLIPRMAAVAVPSRLYNSLASGRPILASTEAVSELARIVHEERVGWVVPPGEPRQLAAAIREAARDPDRLLEMGRRARRAAEEKFSKQHVIDHWLELFEEVYAS